MRAGHGVVPVRGELIPALLSAALFAIAFPPFPLVVPVFVCLAPVSVAVAQRADGSESWRSAARIGFWFAFVGFALNLYWIGIALALYTSLSYLAYAATVVAFGALGAATLVLLFVARRASRLPMLLLVPAVWVTFEVVLLHLSDLAFPWLPLGLATARTPVLAQAAELSGVHGLSVWIAAINGVLADAWLARAHRRAAIVRVIAAIAMVGVLAAYGAWRMRTIVLRPVAPIAIVQPNIPQEEKWQAENQRRIAGILAGLTRGRLDRHDAKLVVWPEAALPGFFDEHPEWQAALARLTTTYDTPILFGVLDVTFHSSGEYDYYNAAMLADTTGSARDQPAYHKHYLVPIVERVPFLNPRWFAQLKYFGGFGRGTHPVPFHLPFGDIGTLVCYESIFPQLSRTYRREGAELLANITNDAWFGTTIAPHQHEAHLALRAIENRVGIVRAANTGISAYVDPLGRFHGETPLFVPATRTYQTQTTDILTLYDRVGDWAGSVAVVFSVVLVGVAWRGRRRGGG